MIQKRGDKFVVTNKAGSKVLGTHASKEKAQKQLAAIEISKAKHMKENKTFKAFRSTLNESEYSEVLTGYGNRSAHKDDAGLHHLQSAGALAGINAMLATIGKGTYLDPNEAFLKMKVRLNVVQLDFAWKPGSWDGGVGSYDIPVVQFGRVDGYDAQTGQIRFDGKANPTGGYTELNLHVDVELTPESLYVVSAKLSPSATVAESVEVAEDLQTPERAKEMRQKYKDEWLKGDTAARKVKKKDAAEKADQTKIYGKGGKVVATRKAKPTQYTDSRGTAKPVDYTHWKKDGVVAEDLQTPAREREMKRKIDKADDAAQRAYQTRMTKTGTIASRASKQEDKHERKLVSLLKRDEKEYSSPRTYGRGGKLVKRGSRAEVKEEMEQIDEAGAAKLARMGYAYDRARVGARGVLNPERKQQMRDAYYKQREKVEANKAKRVAAGTFDKGRELEALHKKYEIRRAKNAVKEEIEQIDELSKTTKDSYVAKRGSQLSSMMYGSGKHYASLTGKQQANAVKGIKRATGVKEATEQLDEVSPPDMEHMTGSKHAKASFTKQYGKRGKSVMYATAWKLHNKKKAEMQEALIGGQKKLDMNKNKRLDSQDFALLRAKKKKTILTQKVQDGKKIGSPRPIAKYEGK